jgi:hypothetical protein
MHSYIPRNVFDEDDQVHSAYAAKALRVILNIHQIFTEYAYSAYLTKAKMLFRVLYTRHMPTGPLQVLYLEKAHAFTPLYSAKANKLFLELFFSLTACCSR